MWGRKAADETEEAVPSDSAGVCRSPVKKIRFSKHCEIFRRPFIQTMILGSSLTLQSRCLHPTSSARVQFMALVVDSR